MTPEDLAKTKVELTTNLNYMCDMHKCQNKVQIVMITTDLIEWQLCASCYEKYLQACANLNAPNTVLHTDAATPSTPAPDSHEPGCPCEKCIPF